MKKITNDVKIIIGVTFREFNGSENEKIQRLFIESIKNQNYSNWRMVVTIFNERFVQQEIEKYAIDAIFHMNGPVSGYKFSLTDVLLNAIYESNKEENTIIIWTTCDVILQPNFFEQIIAHSSKNFFAISHPHITYSSINDLGSANYIPASLGSGMDMMIMDGEVFRHDRNVEIIKKYKYINWGIFEHFLVGLAQLNNGKRINLFGICNISKVENDRKVGAETNDWLLNCWRINKVTLDRFISDHKLTDDIFNLTYCHMQFQVEKNKLWHFVKFAGDYLEYLKGLVRRRVVQRLPNNIKNVIKKAIR
jgi:choline kinase